jgi:cytochrome c peroxidase
MALLGRKLFFEPALSVSGRMSCASCHSPDHAFGPPNDLAVQLGGPNLDQPGIRAVPNLTYQEETPNFSIGPEAGEEQETRLHPSSTGAARTASAAISVPSHDRPKAADPAAAAAALVPEGGFFWDGRSNTLQGQALGPLLNPLEMGNASDETVIDKLRKLSYIADFKALFGPFILNNPRLLLSEALFAIGRYESEEKSFHAFDSKYDAYLAGRASLSAAEMRGLKLFEDPKKGNCASCHPDRKSRDGRAPVFTDYQFEALGLPRNAQIKANADPAFYDLGICGPVRSDSYSQQPQNCGLFKTPSLRNVASRHAYFHNGVFSSLDQVMHFYVERDTHPEKFYPRGPDGTVNRYNDLPQQYRANVDVIDVPLDREQGESPALDEAEIQDVIAFLGTLSDGYPVR